MTVATGRIESGGQTSWLPIPDQSKYSEVERLAADDTGVYVQLITGPAVYTGFDNYWWLGKFDFGGNLLWGPILRLDQDSFDIKVDGDYVFTAFGGSSPWPIVIDASTGAIIYEWHDSGDTSVTVEDDWDRADPGTGHWGTAVSGQVWNDGTGGGPYITVDGGRGRIENPGGDFLSDTIQLPFTAMTFTDGVIDVELDMADSVTVSFHWGVQRSTLPLFGWEVFVHTTILGDLEVDFGWYRTGGGSDAAVTLPFSPTTPFTIRVVDDGSTIRMRIWATAGSEPSTWDVELDHSGYPFAGMNSVYVADNNFTTTRNLWVDNMTVHGVIPGSGGTWLSGAARGPDTRMYVARQMGGYARIGPGGIEEQVASVEYAGSVDYSNGAHPDPNRFYVWVAGSGVFRFQEWQGYPSMSYLRTVLDGSVVTGSSFGPDAIAVDPASGRIYLHITTARHVGEIRAYTSDGDLLWSVSDQGVEDDATQMQVANGLVYVAGYRNHPELDAGLLPAMVVVSALDGSTVQAAVEWGQDSTDSTDIYGLAVGGGTPFVGGTSYGPAFEGLGPITNGDTGWITAFGRSVIHGHVHL